MYLIRGRTWGRAVGIILAVVSAIANMTFVAAYPLWSIIIVALDVIVIYALAVARPGSTIVVTLAGGGANRLSFTAVKLMIAPFFAGADPDDSDFYHALQAEAFAVRIRPSQGEGGSVALSHHQDRSPQSFL